jgi:hypothetical protein
LNDLLLFAAALPCNILGLRDHWLVICNSEPVQGFHEVSWRLVVQFSEEAFPVWCIPTAKMSAQLPAKFKPWQAAVVQGPGIRRPENEHYVYWLNLVTTGITSSLKTDWFLSFLTQVLTDQPSNSIAIILHANRAAQLPRGVKKDQKPKTEWGALKLVLPSQSV